MILVLLGTQDKSFIRLLKNIDELIISGTIKEEVIVQSGYTKYETNNMKLFDYISKDELNDYIKKASFVITHAGVGSIMDCIRNNKKVIAVPRLKKYDEHTNDHQLQILKEFNDLNYIIPIYDLNDLNDIILNIDNVKLKNFESNTKIPNLIVEYIEGLGEKNEK